MKPLAPRNVAGFLCKVALTRDRECDCRECRRHIGELAEHRIAGQALDENLDRVAHHMSVCPECHEECQALEYVLRGGQ